MKRVSLFFCSVLLVSFALVVTVSLAKESKAVQVGVYELKKGNLSVRFTNWGATVMSVVLPDKNGKLGDVVLGYDHIKDYMNDTVYFGGIVGRVANRIGHAGFTVNGKHCKIVANEGNNTLHGGKKGFSDVVWKVEKYDNNGKNPSIVFTYNSRDGEQGFPGDLHVKVSYKLVRDSQLKVVMEAKPKHKATPINLAQHTYWNLGGHDSGTILSEEFQLLASHYTPVNNDLIPTGKIVAVIGTPYDFRKPHEIGSKVHMLPKGYDINYCLDTTNYDNNNNNKIRKAAVVVDHKSGRKMELYTNQKGLQLYTSGGLKNVKGKNGAVYEAYDGLCLETQGYPDSVNHPQFPSQIVNPGDTYKHLMLFKFSTVN